MANYTSIAVTTLGQALIAKAQAGAVINFTRMQAGSGQLGGGNPAARTGLITPVAYFNINSITTNANTANVAGILENTSLSLSTYICEIGLFAQDPDVGEILYAYANAQAQGDTFPPISSGPYSSQFKMNVAIGIATTVTATIPPGTYLPVSDIDVNPTPNTVPRRTTGGQIKAAAPVATNDVARKDTVDNALVMGMQRQAIINGGFTVAQRGTTFTVPAGTASFVRYTFDRWFELEDPNGGNLPTITSKIEQNSTDGNFLRLTFSGSGSALGAGAQASFVQPIENGTRFLCGLGKKITVSFEARSSLSGKKISCWAQQTYGTGGTPSSAEPINGKVLTLSSTFQKFTYTFDTNTLVGKVFGTNNDDTVNIRIGYMWGSGLASLNGDTVAETYRGAGNLDIRNVQVNAGDTVLPFLPRSFGEELALCQRYYEKSYPANIAPGTNTGWGLHVSTLLPANYTAGSRLLLGSHIKFKVEKRLTPTMTFLSDAGAAGLWWAVNYGGINVGTNFTCSTGVNIVTSNANNVTQAGDIYGHWTADAEL